MKKASTARAIPHPDYDDEEFFTPLLGADDDNVKTLGVIRPGIMVLRRAANRPMSNDTTSCSHAA